jgi:hypothetical protein
MQTKSRFTAVILDMATRKGFMSTYKGAGRDFYLNGLIVAMILWLTALVLGGLALARSGRITTDNTTKKPF